MAWEQQIEAPSVGAFVVFNPLLPKTTARESVALDVVYYYHSHLVPANRDGSVLLCSNIKVCPSSQDIDFNLNNIFPRLSAIGIFPAQHPPALR